MIDIRDIKKDYAGTVILDGVSAHIARGEKVALIGRNGAGKTTLLGILSGEDADYSGTVSKAGDVEIETVPQRFPDFAGTALDFVSENARLLRNELSALEAEMGMAEGKKLDAILARYGELRERYERAGGDEAEDRAGRYLEGLGLGERKDVEVASLSGGEKNVLALARAIASRPELLVLDEPGNHLDFWGLTWLEGFIREYPGAVLVVSHNRYLLDRTVTRVIEIEGGKAVSYAGNYSAYRIERLRKTVAGGMAYRADMKKLERLEELVKRFEIIARAHPDPKWGRRLRARKTQLEKAREAARDKPADPDSSFSVAFAGEKSRADRALTVSDFSCVVGEGERPRTLLEEVSLAIGPGERVALVGRNGSGKTTFLDAILREGSEGNPLVRIGPSMTVAYVTQHGDRLDRDATLVDACLAAGLKNGDEAGKALSRFLFPREALERKIGSLSGGELNRLQLALAAIAHANFLILDEPTNHLDIASCEAIEDAIAEFEGTILVVSHDRFFLDRVATRVVEIEDGDFVEHDGNFSEFWYRKYGSRGISPFASGRAATAAGRAATIARPRDGSKPGGKNGNSAQAGHSERNGAKGSERSAKETDAIEKRIVLLEQERERLERELTAAYGAGDLKKARALGASLADTGTLIERLYDEWN